MDDDTLKKSVIGQDYLRMLYNPDEKMPPIDAYLDYLSKLKELKQEAEYQLWIDNYNRELAATLEILKRQT
jgi:hypothetical protein